MIAPDRIEPYAVRLLLRGDLADPAALVARLLEDVARRCDGAGATVIGHLKAHVRTAGGSFHCSLTSLRGGARCAGPLVKHPVAVGSLELDLAVLVYGLPRAVVAEIAEKGLTQLREGGVCEWSCLTGEEERGADSPQAKPTTDHLGHMDHPLNGDAPTSGDPHDSGDKH